MTTRCHWWASAGLVLATAIGPAAAETPPAVNSKTSAQTLPAVNPETPTLPPPRETAAPAPAPEGATVAGTASCAAPAAGGAVLPGRTGHHMDCQAKMWGYPSEFIAPPLGAVMAANMRPMVANADAAGMVLFRMDFLYGCEGLNVHGADRLARIASRMIQNPYPIIIERTPEPGLAESRRAAVLALLAREGVPVPPERVVIGNRLSVGLSGPDAMRVQLYYLSNMDYQNQPVPILTVGGIGGTGAGGTSSTSSTGGTATGVGAGVGGGLTGGP
jgi:hypothetical protein